MPVALAVVFPLGIVSVYSDGEIPRIVGVFLQVAFAWLMSFGLIGLARKTLTRENRIIRYLSDASYWLYLAHIPLIIGAQILVRDWPVPAAVKFILVCVVVTAFCSPSTKPSSATPGSAGSSMAPAKDLQEPFGDRAPSETAFTISTTDTIDNHSHFG